MLSPERPTNIDEQPTGLDHWVHRCCTNRKSSIEYHLIYKGCVLTVHPARGALVQKDGRELLVANPDGQKYKGRNWLPTLVGDIESAVQTVIAGGGATIPQTFGDKVREEIARRKTSGQRTAADREHWIEWLTDDELPIAMGAWLARTGIVNVSFNVSRRPSVDFHPTNDEFEKAGSASDPGVMWSLLGRLAHARGALK